jgi:hypothetical protein
LFSFTARVLTKPSGAFRCSANFAQQRGNVVMGWAVRKVDFGGAPSSAQDVT